MSSTFKINVAELEEAGVVITESPHLEETEERIVNFPEYPYFRGGDIFEGEPHTIQISCSGSFRRWLLEFLFNKGVNYAVFW